MDCWKKDLPPPSPTGCEYYLLPLATNDSRSQVSSYDIRRLPLDPSRFNHVTLEARLLYELKREEIMAIEDLLRERNSRTVEDGEWAVFGLHVFQSEPKELGLVIRFYRHGKPLDGGGVCLQRKVCNEEHSAEAVMEPEYKFASDSSRRGMDNKSTGASSDNASVHRFTEEATGGLESDNLPTENEESEGSLSDNTTAGQLTSDCESTSTEHSGIHTPASYEYLHESEDFDTTFRPTLPAAQFILPESTAETLHEHVHVHAHKLENLTSNSNDDEYHRIRDRVKGRILREEWDEAERLLKRMLEIQEETLALIEKEKFQTMHELAAVYRLSKRRNEAIEIFITALEGRTRVLGESDKDTLETMHNLALSFYGISRFHDAEPLFARCLEGRSKTLGENHVDTLDTLYHLAECRECLGGYREAAELLERCLESRKKILGEAHEDTIWTAYTLGRAYECFDMLTDAESVYKLWFDSSPSCWKPTFGDALASLYEWQNRKQESKIRTTL